MRTLRFPFLLLPLIACSDDGTGPEGLDGGEFEAQITGDIQRTIEGVAVFEVNQDEEFFAVTMDNEGSEVSMTVVLDRTSRPGTGSYTFADFDSGSFADVVINQPGGAEFFESTTGQLIITSSSSRRVAGSVTLAAAGRDGAPGAIAVSATFTAVCRQGGNTSCD